MTLLDHRNGKDKESLLSLKPRLILALLFNQFRYNSPEKNFDPENAVNFKYYGNAQIQALKFPSKRKLSPYFLVMYALQIKIFDNLDYLSTEVHK